MTRTTTAHPFDSALALTPTGVGEFRGRTTAAYANMVGPFGGVTAATLLRAVPLDSRHIGDPRPPSGCATIPAAPSTIQPSRR